MHRVEYVLTPTGGTPTTLGGIRYLLQKRQGQAREGNHQGSVEEAYFKFRELNLSI